MDAGAGTALRRRVLRLEDLARKGARERLGVAVQGEYGHLNVRLCRFLAAHYGEDVGGCGVPESEKEETFEQLLKELEERKLDLWLYDPAPTIAVGSGTMPPMLDYGPSTGVLYLIQSRKQ